MPGSSCRIFFPAGQHNLQTAEALLAGRGLLVVPDGDRLVVRWGDGPRLRVAFAEGQAVRQEAAFLGNATLHANKLSRCDARFEIAFDDLHRTLDETNTLIETQVTLQEATGGVLFNLWNGEMHGLTSQDVRVPSQCVLLYKGVALGTITISATEGDFPGHTGYLGSLPAFEAVASRFTHVGEDGKARPIDTNGVEVRWLGEDKIEKVTGMLVTGNRIAWR